MKNRRATKCDMKWARKDILDAVWQQAGITQTELHKLAPRLSKRSVVNILTKLIKEGQITETPNRDDKREKAYMQGY